MKEHGGFEHNQQSLRVVEVLEERYPYFNGLNLCWETREGLIKHSSDYDNPPQAVAEYEPGQRSTLEAQIIDLADEIAYNNHDIDDGLKAGYISLDDLCEIPLWGDTYAKVRKKFPEIDRERHIYQTISHLIGALIDDLVRTSLELLASYGINDVQDVRNHAGQLVSFSPTMRGRNNELKIFLRAKLYRHYKVERMRVKAERLLHALFVSYQQTPSLLPDDCQRKIALYGKERTICDYVAGMTDRYAMDEYTRLFDPYERV
jgi:dGTPase